MAAAGHAIKEVVSQHRCECGENYKQWGSRPTPPCLTCEKPRLRKTAPDAKGTERTKRAGKRTKYEESKDKGKIEHPTTPFKGDKTESDTTRLPRPYARF